MAVYNPFPHYMGFTVSPPVIPKLYFDVYSEEQRIKALCSEYQKLMLFTDSLVDTVNEQYIIIEEMKKSFKQVITEIIKTDDEVRKVITDAVQEYVDGITHGTTYDELAEHGFLYPPQIGA